MSDIKGTWKPVLDKFGVDKRMMDIIARYCDRHSKKEDMSADENLMSLLPLCIKVFNKINLCRPIGDIQVVFTDEVKEDKDISFQEEHFIGESQEDFTMRIEELSVDTAANYINHALIGMDYLLIDLLVYSYGIQVEGTKSPEFYIGMRFDVRKK